MQCYIEHANVAVLDMAEAIRFLTIAFPHFRVRGGGEITDGGQWKKWCHLGTDTIYFAIEQSSTVDQPRADWDSHAARINHVGFCVDDVAEIKRKTEAAGYNRNALIDESPSRKRLYVDDGSGADLGVRRVPLRRSGGAERLLRVSTPHGGALC